MNEEDYPTITVEKLREDFAIYKKSDKISFTANGHVLEYNRPAAKNGDAHIHFVIVGEH